MSRKKKVAVDQLAEEKVAVDQSQAEPDILPLAKELRKPMSAEARDRLREAIKARYANDPELRKRMSEIAKRTWSDPALRQKMVDRAKDYWTPERKAEQSAKMKAALSNPETKARMKAGQDAYWTKVKKALATNEQ